jgi:transaldolase
VTGATSNPTIFAKAITGSDLYDDQLQALAEAGEQDLQELFFSLALDDVRDAARLLRPEYDRTGGRDGFISFECTPDLADDTEATIAQAIGLWRRLDQPNVMIKVLWASTGTKDPAYSDVVDVSELIGPDVVSTMPDSTLRAFADHGQVARTVDRDPNGASQALGQAAAAGIDLAAVTSELEREGVAAFCASYQQLLDCIQSKLGVLAGGPS